ncbi:hypothetical protein KUCAC02_014369 [Chaenocephalus aceratus]|uniref:Uncharacterized protein n=1 Tax=Chaenocephalus aceratus TaxID=36190 RepID=A0ACB9WFD7_CHAAC|nr:hypothetical protein KUCAC02_014369 [Chaenocephalus aceratus]
MTKLLFVFWLTNCPKIVELITHIFLLLGFLSFVGAPPNGGGGRFTSAPRRSLMTDELVKFIKEGTQSTRIKVKQ